MGDFLVVTRLADSAYDWLRDRILVAAIAEQAITVAVLTGLLFVYAPPLRRLLGAKVVSVSAGAAQQVLMVLASVSPWLVLLLTFWFTILVFHGNGLDTTVLRLAESLVLAWVVIKLTSRLVRNETLARALAVLAFVVAALNIAGLIHPVVDAARFDGVLCGRAADQCSAADRGRDHFVGIDLGSRCGGADRRYEAGPSAKPDAGHACADIETHSFHLADAGRGPGVGVGRHRFDGVRGVLRRGWCRYRLWVAEGWCQTWSAV